MRNCASKRIETGVSKCPIDMEKIIGALVVPHGVKLEASTALTAAALTTACHAASASRAYAIKPFVEFAKEGGEANVSAVGYGGNKVTGFSALTLTFTMDEFYAELSKGLLKDMNGEYDVYFYDRNNILYGVDDDTDYLAGIALSAIYPVVNPFPTSGENSSIQVAFAVKDAKDFYSHIGYKQYDFDIDAAAYPLTAIKTVTGSAANKYKIVEVTGDLDITAEFAALAGTNLAACLGTGATYASGEITVSSLSVAAPSVLATSGVKGMFFTTNP